MKKKWLLITLLLLSFCLIPTGGNNATGGQTITASVTEPLVLSEWSNGASPPENIADNQTITLRNPTFEEMKDFILKDTTSRKPFILNEFECRHFATEVNNNAKAAGWRCGFALLCYSQGQHAIIAFNTIDRGLIFIEPQTDAAIDVKVGGMYQDQEIVEILIAW